VYISGTFLTDSLYPGIYVGYNFFARVFGLGVCFLSSFSASIKTGFAKDFGRM
jgi:hypothetical protein